MGDKKKLEILESILAHNFYISKITKRGFHWEKFQLITP